MYPTVPRVMSTKKNLQMPIDIKIPRYPDKGLSRSNFMEKFLAMNLNAAVISCLFTNRNCNVFYELFMSAFMLVLSGPQ